MASEWFGHQAKNVNEDHHTTLISDCQEKGGENGTFLAEIRRYRSKQRMMKNRTGSSLLWGQVR